MAPKNEGSSAGKPTLREHVNEDQNATSFNAHDQILLKAFQDLIVRVVDPKQMNDMNQIPLGPEAEKLITALQEFISSIVVRSQSEAPITVEVSLDEDDDFDDSGEDDLKPSKKVKLSQISSSDSHGNALGNTNSGDLAVMEKPQPIFEEKLLRAFREHVFNRMPIRLLCFEAQGSCFKITLLERGALFARLTSMVQNGKHKKFRPMKNRGGKVETEEGAIERLVSKHAGYAILSHTWLRTAPGEVTYGDWNKGLFNSEAPGYRKLVNFCKAAWKGHGLAFGWMDTVCINKESSSELDESIRSMYNWYSRATVCITYLAETETLTNMHLDPWFTRGWTLQELLAPPVIKFYNSHWKRLVDHADNDRDHTEIMHQIESATSISKAELDDIKGVPISRRMQLAANREVTREEDTAYSLMGIFDINISTAYGEGAPRAFFRLLQAMLISSYDILDILNWAGPLPSSRPHNSSVLPTSPRNYACRSSNKNLVFPIPSLPLTLTHMGLHMSVILMPGISISEASSPHSFHGDFNASVDYNHTTGFFENGSEIPAAYSLLDSRTKLGYDGWAADRTWYQLTFAVFNFELASDFIFLPKTCIAIPLKCSAFEGGLSNKGEHTRIQTSEPIVFELASGSAKESSNKKFWMVGFEFEEEHGMGHFDWYL